MSLIVCYVFFNTTAYADTSQQMVDKDSYFRLLDEFKSESFEREVIKKFDLYLINSTSYNNAQYLSGLNILFTHYLKTISNLSGCEKKIDEFEYAYSSEWLKAFEKKFGKKLLAKHYDALKNHIFEMGLNKSGVYCRDDIKECIYIESYFIKALRDYLSLFIKFTDTLKGPELGGINKWKSAAELFLETVHNPIQEIMTEGNINLALCALGIQEQKEIPQDMADFFSNHPNFSKPFNYIKAIKDLKKILD